MRVPLSWLREFVPVHLETPELCERLTMGGLEVEGVENVGAGIAGVIVGEIVSTAPIVGSTRLTLCNIRSGGGGTVPVVCGATNMKAGDRVAYAPPSTLLPGGRRIEQVEIRGATSAGMLCSEAELGLSDDANGILIVAPEAPVGERVARVLGLEDTVLDVSVTPNRGDCLSILGVAREVALLTGQRLRRMRVNVGRGETAANAAIAVRIEDPNGCGRYAARLVQGVGVADSPRWMQQRVQAVGLRPINNIVDVTNLVMIERGQPLHAFDYDRLPRGEIIVRRAGTSTAIRTLDGVVRPLIPDDLLITTGEEPIAIAGVMGGADTEVCGTTSTILLEAAWFNPRSVRRTARRLDLHSEAAYRFERGVDIGGVPAALERAVALLTQVAGARQASGLAEAFPSATSSTPIVLRPNRVEEILGFSLPRSEMRNTLRGLGASVAPIARGTLTVVPPTFRSDLQREIDLIEELARVAGYHRIPATMPAVQLGGQMLPERLRWERELKRVLVGYGLSEVISLSFASARTNQLFAGVGVDGDPIGLANPLHREEAQLRRSLLGGLIAMWRHNRNQGMTRVAGFSISKVFWQTSARSEGWRLAALLAGGLSRHGLGPSRSVEFADAKGVVEALFERLHLLDQVHWERWREEMPFHPGKSARIRCGEEEIGLLGAFHPDVEEELDVDGALWVFELDMEKLLSYSPMRCAFRGLPRFPAIVRDLAVVVDEDFASDRVVRFVQQWRRELVEDVSLFDEYVGAPIPTGKKSLAYSIAYRALDRTLTDDEVNALQNELTAALCAELPVAAR